MIELRSCTSEEGWEEEESHPELGRYRCRSCSLPENPTYFKDPMTVIKIVDGEKKFVDACPKCQSTNIAAQVKVKIHDDVFLREGRRKFDEGLFINLVKQVTEQAHLRMVQIVVQTYHQMGGDPDLMDERLWQLVRDKRHKRSF